MKYVFVLGNRVPAPIIDGRDIPLHNLLSNLSATPIFLTECGKGDYTLYKNQSSFLLKVLCELFLFLPYFVLLKRHVSIPPDIGHKSPCFILTNQYKYWIIGEFYARKYQVPHYVITNDCITYYYRQQINNSISNLDKMKSITKWLRSFLIRQFEIKVSRTTFIIVQTNLEGQRLNELGVSRSRIKIYNNGCNLEIIKKDQPKNIVMFSHLAGERSRESKWFLDNVLVDLFTKTERKILLIGRAPEDEKRKNELSKYIEFAGYVDDLAEVYADALITIIPTRHDSGLINRLVEAMKTKTAIISFIGPSKTLGRFASSTKIMECEAKDEIITQIQKLIRNQAFREECTEINRQVIDEYLNYYADKNTKFIAELNNI